MVLAHYLTVLLEKWLQGERTHSLKSYFTTLHHDSIFFQNETIGRSSTSASETKDLRRPDRQMGIRVLVKKNIFICG